MKPIKSGWRATRRGTRCCAGRLWLPDTPPGSPAGRSSSTCPPSTRAACPQAHEHTESATSVADGCGATGPTTTNASTSQPRSLQCSRLRVHRNLVVALIIHSAMLVVISLPVVGGDSVPSYRDIGWLCRVVVGGKLWAALAVTSWMFCEGLLLHARATTATLRRDYAPFKVYYLLGWGVPLVLIVSWGFVMNWTLKSDCWEGYGRSPYVWIITGPMIAALGVNLIFLINIVRILMTKMQTSSTFEVVQVRRGMKATALLFPLLGITHLLFCFNPRDDSTLEEAYMLTNALLQSSQGIFVSVLYCFMNLDVQTAVRRAWVRAALRRNPNHRYTWKCGTRTSLSSAANLSPPTRLRMLRRVHSNARGTELNSMTISDV